MTIPRVVGWNSSAPRTKQGRSDEKLTCENRKTPLLDPKRHLTGLGRFQSTLQLVLQPMQKPRQTQLLKCMTCGQEFSETRAESGGG